MSLPLLRPPAAATVDPYALGREGLRELLADQPAFRAEQVHRWLVRGVDDPAAMTDLPLELRQRLTELLDPPPKILRRSTADDGLTHKVLLQMSSGGAVERRRIFGGGSSSSVSRCRSSNGRSVIAAGSSTPRTSQRCTCSARKAGWSASSSRRPSRP